jgi:hypothetical protein
MTNPVFHRFRWQGSRYSTVYEPFIPVFHRFHRFEFFGGEIFSFARKPRRKSRFRQSPCESVEKHREANPFLGARKSGARLPESSLTRLYGKLLEGIARAATHRALNALRVLKQFETPFQNSNRRLQNNLH